MQKTARLRIVIDADIALFGTPVNVLTENLQQQIDNLVRNGAITGSSEAELNAWGTQITVRPEPLSEKVLADFMQQRIENGDLHPEDLSVRLARFGLMDPDTFIVEMRERMENEEWYEHKADEDDNEDEGNAIETFEMRRVEDLKPGNYVDLESSAAHAGTAAAKESYGIVESIHQETPECIVVAYESHATAGYPIGTELKVSLPNDVPDPVVRVHPLGEPDTWSEWKISQNLTDRWGDLNHVNDREKPLELLEHDTMLFEGLQAQMWDEITFITRKDGQFGILYEVEFTSIESEKGSVDADSLDLKPHAELVKIILDGLASIAPDFPGVEFCVPEECNIVKDRPAAWAFVRDGLLDEAGREKLGQALLAI